MRGRRRRQPERRLPRALSPGLLLASGIFLGQIATALAQQADEDSTQALAAAAQNPVAAMYSLPLQNNTYFGAGPNHDKAYDVLNIQPVLPFTAGDWNIISRTIAPLIYVPTVRTGLGTAALGEDATSASAGPAGIPETFGLGDINQTFFFSPAAPGQFIWGVGPSIDLPTATERFIGSGKLSVGPSAVGLVMPRPWVIGMLTRQLFSIAGPKADRRQPDPAATIRQLQPAERLVLKQFAGHHRELERGFFAALECPDRRRSRQNFHDRGPANQRLVPSLRLCRASQPRPTLDASLSSAVSVSTMSEPLPDRPAAPPKTSVSSLNARDTVLSFAGGIRS
jgi:hypothetical protein